jgi:hypothetical protein
LTSGQNVDDREPVQRLFRALREDIPELEKLLEECTDHWGYEDAVYRFYHQSFKCYAIQEQTSRIVGRLTALSPDRPLNERFLEIVREGTGKTFRAEDNSEWSRVVRPMLEAFFHARFFLEMGVRYGKELRFPPRVLPSGWAAFLYLHNLR